MGVPPKCRISRGPHPSANVLYCQHEHEKKCMYARRVMEVEQATFTPLVFTTGGMAPQCQVYHKRLAELLSAMKGEDYSTTMSWIRPTISLILQFWEHSSYAWGDRVQWTLTSKEDFLDNRCWFREKILNIAYYYYLIFLSLFVHVEIMVDFN